MKPAITAKLCQQACDFYADAMKLLQLDTLNKLWPKVSAAIACINDCLFDVGHVWLLSCNDLI